MKHKFPSANLDKVLTDLVRSALRSRAYRLKVEPKEWSIDSVSAALKNHPNDDSFDIQIAILRNDGKVFNAVTNISNHLMPASTDIPGFIAMHLEATIKVLIDKITSEGQEKRAVEPLVEPSALNDFLSRAPEKDNILKSIEERKKNAKWKLE